MLPSYWFKRQRRGTTYVREDYVGNTGIEVTKLGFGTLVMGSLQANLPPEEGAKVLRRAFEQGICFLDTAHTMYV